MNLTRLTLLIGSALSATLVGCAQNSWDPADRQGGPISPPQEVYRLVCAYRPPIWKNYHPNQHNRVEGFKFNLYLISRETNKGIHTNGTLQAKLFTRQVQEDGTYVRTEVATWTKDMSDAVPTTKPYQLGWGYQPHFYWGDLNLEGQEVEIVVSYHPPQGRPIFAQTRVQRVPIRG